MSSQLHQSAPEQTAPDRAQGPSSGGGGGRGNAAALDQARGGGRGLGAIAGIEGYKGDPARLAQLIEGGFGQGFGGTQVQEGDTSGSAVATSQGSTVTVGSDFADMSAEEQDFVLAHEFAHQAQQTSGEFSPSSKGAVEADANTAAATVLGGGRANLAASARPGQAYNWEWSDVAETALNVATFGAYGAATSVAEWTLEQIGGPSDLLRCVQQAGETVAKELIDQLATANVSVLIAFITGNPTHALVTYILGKLDSEQIAEVLGGLTTEQLVGFIALLAAGPFLLYILPAIALLEPEQQEQVLSAFSPEALGRALLALPETTRELLQAAVNTAWPVGVGMSLDAGLGATFGYPIYLGVDAFLEVSHSAPDTIRMKRGGQLTEAFDTGVGAGGFIGFGGQETGGGNREGGFGIGAEAGAQFQAGLKQCVSQTFEFPVMNDAGFSAFLLMAAGVSEGAVFQLASVFIDELRALNPMNYNTANKFEFKVFAEGNAAAQAGVRTAGENTEEGGSTWDSSEGSRDTGGRPPWYDLRSLIRASVTGNAAAEAGVSAEMEVKSFTDNPDGTRVPSEMEFALGAEGSATAGIVHAIPILSGMMGQLPSFETGGGVKVVWQVSGSPDDEQGVFSEPSVHLIGKTGAGFDRLEGAGSETDIELGTIGPETFASVENFLAAQRGATFRRRASIGGDFGRSYVSALNRQGTFNTMLPSEYRRYGFRVEGYIDVTCAITSDQIRGIYNDVISGAQEYAEGGPVLQSLQNDVIALLTGGEVSPALSGTVRSVAQRLLDSLTELDFSGVFGLGAAAGAQASEGAKVRLEGNVAGAITYERNLLEELGDGARPTVEQLENLIRNIGTAGSALLDVPAENA